MVKYVVDDGTASINFAISLLKPILDTATLNGFGLH